MRIEYKRHEMCPHHGDSIIVKKRGGGERVIPVGKWWVNRNTPVGEDADLYELKPYGGKKWIDWDHVIAIERP